MTQKLTEDHFNYHRIAEAIQHISNTYTSQPTLGELAESAHVSEYHYQRLFKEWVGVSPKKFMQYLTVNHAKKVLKNSQSTLFQAAYESGLSGTGRLHDLFVTLEAMTPGEYKNGGKNLQIAYQFADSLFGQVLIASTPKGICHVAFSENENKGEQSLLKRYPNAELTKSETPLIQQVKTFFESGFGECEPIHIHLSGTPFQVKVWEMLLKIPAGVMTTYGSMAEAIGQPNAARAVGTAIGANPIAYLIPCHRVIQATGHLGGYMWGPSRKQAILGWEGIKNDAHAGA